MGRYGIVLTIVGSIVGLAMLGTGAQAATETVFRDSFNQHGSMACPGFSDGVTFGSWRTQFAGYGCVAPVEQDGQHWLRLNPRAATAADTTHAALVTGPTVTGDMIFRGTTKTIAQTRQQTPPNAWETSWLLWHYTDNEHFYYLVPRANGWELGKRDPSYPGGQRFLATGTTPGYPLNDVKQFEIKQVGTTITVSINGQVLTTFTDTERPYTTGAIGLYTEDADALFGDIHLARVTADAPAPVEPAPAPNNPAPQPAEPVPSEPGAAAAQPADAPKPPHQSGSAAGQLAETGQNRLLVGGVAAGSLLLAVGLLVYRRLAGRA